MMGLPPEQLLFALIYQKQAVFLWASWTNFCWNKNSSFMYTYEMTSPYKVTGSLEYVGGGAHKCV